MFYTFKLLNYLIFEFQEYFLLIKVKKSAANLRIKNIYNRKKNLCLIFARKINLHEFNII